MSVAESSTRMVRQGIDVEELQGFCEYARGHRDEVRFALEAKGVYEGRVAHTRTELGPYTLGGQRIDRLARQYVHHMGAHKEVETALGFVEPSDREEPTEVALAALSACITTAVSASAVARGIELSHLETRVRIGWDPFVFLHLEETDRDGELVNQFDGLEIELLVDGHDLSEADWSYLQASVRRSAVYNLFSLGHSNEPVVSLASPVRAS